MRRFVTDTLIIAERNLGKGDEHDAMEVVAVALEELVRLHRQHHVKISLRPTSTPCVAFTLVSNASSIFHARRHTHTDGVTPVR